jgi:uncharacterized protein YndB with AHSA1/START domain
MTLLTIVLLVVGALLLGANTRHRRQEALFEGLVDGLGLRRDGPQATGAIGEVVVTAAFVESEALTPWQLVMPRLADSLPLLILPWLLFEETIAAATAFATTLVVSVVGAIVSGFGRQFELEVDNILLPFDAVARPDLLSDPQLTGPPTGDPAFDDVVSLHGPVASALAHLDAPARLALRTWVAAGGRIEGGWLRCVVGDVAGVVAAAQALPALYQRVRKPARVVLSERALHDPEPGVRRMALEALLDDRRDWAENGSADTTVAALVDPDPDAAVEALGRDAVATVAAAHVLSKRGDARHVPALRAAAEGADSELAARLDAAIASIQARIGPAVGDRLSTPDAPDLRGAISADRGRAGQISRS